MKYRFLLILVLSLALPMVLFGQTDEEYLASLLAEPDTQAFETYLLEKADADNYQEIKNRFLDRAKELVLSNEYKPALQILEALLRVDLDNLEVQEIYIAVGKMIKEGEAAELAKAEPETVQKPVVESEVSEQETAGTAEILTTDQIARAVAKAVADAMAQGGVSRAGDARSIERKTTETTSAGESGIEKEIQTAEDTPTWDRRKPQAVSFKDIIDWSLHFGAADLLLYGSQFYTDFYDESQLFMSYGLSLDFEVILKLNKLNLSGEINFDAFFADFIPLSGTEVSYKLMLGAALPKVIPVPLYARLGFGQLWYLFGDETPNRLITAVPSPLLGVKLNGLKLGTLFSLDGSVDYYLITFFTSYITSAFDISAALEINLPIKSALAFTARVEVLPTVIIGSGGAETSAKLKISFGIGNDEDE